MHSPTVSAPSLASLARRHSACSDDSEEYEISSAVSEAGSEESYDFCSMTSKDSASSSEFGAALQRLQDGEQRSVLSDEKLSVICVHSVSDEGDDVGDAMSQNHTNLTATDPSTDYDEEDEEDEQENDSDGGGNQDEDEVDSEEMQEEDDDEGQSDHHANEGGEAASEDDAKISALEAMIERLGITEPATFQQDPHVCQLEECITPRQDDIDLILQSLGLNLETVSATSIRRRVQMLEPCTCIGCGSEFLSRTQLRKHLMSARRCRRAPRELKQQLSNFHDQYGRCMSRFDDAQKRAYVTLLYAKALLIRIQF